jgi:putative membrane protein
VAGDQEKVSFSRLFQLIEVVMWLTAFWVLRQQIKGPPMLAKFLRPDYWWLVDMGAGILVLFLITLIYHDSHSRGRQGIALFAQMGIMLLPILYLPTAAASNLSPEAARNRSFAYASSGRQGEKALSGTLESILGPGTGARSYDNGKAGLPANPSFLRLVLEPEPYEGKRVVTQGMVYHDDKTPPNSFFCYQLMMVCCAADAKPIGILVESDRTKTLKKGDWVKVSGTVGFGDFENSKFTRITADTVEETVPPKDPYILP